MKNYRKNKHEINSINKKSQSCVNSLRNFITKYKLGVIISIILILVTIRLFSERKEGYNLVELQQSSIINIETPEFTGINLSQIIKNNDETLLVYKELIPGTYRVELNNTTDIGYVERYNSKEMGVDNLIAKHIFEEDGYLIIEDDDVVVKLQGVILTLQQNFYLFGF